MKWATIVCVSRTFQQVVTCTVVCTSVNRKVSSTPYVQHVTTSQVPNSSHTSYSLHQRQHHTKFHTSYSLHYQSPHVFSYATATTRMEGVCPFSFSSMHTQRLTCLPSSDAWMLSGTCRCALLARPSRQCLQNSLVSIGGPRGTSPTSNTTCHVGASGIEMLVP